MKKALNKVPKLRPTYAMLLRHPWLAPLTKPETISEEDEEAGEQSTTRHPAAETDMYDAEVGQWVIEALEQKKQGKMGKKAKPALHTAPLDSTVPESTAPS